MDMTFVYLEMLLLSQLMSLFVSMCYQSLLDYCINEIKKNQPLYAKNIVEAIN